MIELYEKVLSENLTSIQIEEHVREVLYGVKGAGKKLEKKEVEAFLAKMNISGKKVKVVQTRTKGKIILEVDGDVIKTTEDLRSLMSALTAPRHEDTGKEKSGSLTE